MSTAAIFYAHPKLTKPEFSRHGSITECVYREIEKASEEGITSAQIANNLGLPVKKVRNCLTGLQSRTRSLYSFYPNAYTMNVRFVGNRILAHLRDKELHLARHILNWTAKKVKDRKFEYDVAAYLSNELERHPFRFTGHSKGYTAPRCQLAFEFIEALFEVMGVDSKLIYNERTQEVYVRKGADVIDFREYKLRQTG